MKWRNREKMCWQCRIAERLAKRGIIDHHCVIRTLLETNRFNDDCQHFTSTSEQAVSLFSPVNHQLFIVLFSAQNDLKVICIFLLTNIIAIGKVQ